MKYKETIEWNEIIIRDMTKVEKNAYDRLFRIPMHESKYKIVDSVLPENGDDVLVKTKDGVFIDTFWYCQFGEGGFEDSDINEVIAWAHMPTGEKTKE